MKNFYHKKFANKINVKYGMYMNRCFIYHNIMAGNFTGFNFCGWSIFTISQI